VPTSSIEVVRRAAGGQPGGSYSPSAPLFEPIERQLETEAGTLHDGQLALRDLAETVPGAPRRPGLARCATWSRSSGAKATSRAA
jgi:hypothetical protein